MADDLFPITKADVVAELHREIKMRRQVYPRQVEHGRLTEARAERQIALIERAIEIVEASP